MIADLFWKSVARIVSQPAIAAWLIERAKRTPYWHITGEDGSVYMERYWLFNPYPPHSPDQRRWQFPISIRLHLIRREDQDRHLHDHPWNARTIILRGWYIEERELGQTIDYLGVLVSTHFEYRHQGDTASLQHGEYHRIHEVPCDGVWTMFITGRKRGSWGFKVDGAKVPWREYLGISEAA